MVKKFTSGKQISIERVKGILKRCVDPSQRGRLKMCPSIFLKYIDSGLIYEPISVEDYVNDRSDSLIAYLNNVRSVLVNSDAQKKNDLKHLVYFA